MSYELDPLPYDYDDSFPVTGLVSAVAAARDDE